MADGPPVVVVTGAAQGMGAAHVEALARAGWYVYAVDLRSCVEIVEGVREIGGAASSYMLDVAEPGSWQQLAAEIQKTRGSLAGLVNNAGVSCRDSIQDTDDATLARVMGVNLLGPFYGMRALAPLMRDSGGGAIVNISSIAGQLGYHGAAYGASKWGLRGLTKSAAAEYASWGIRVNSIHPGLIETPMVNQDKTFMNACIDTIPLARAGRSEEVSAAVLFLLSSQSSYISGSEVTVDGALVAAGTYWHINQKMQQGSKEDNL